MAATRGLRMGEEQTSGWRFPQETSTLALHSSFIPSASPTVEVDWHLKRKSSLNLGKSLLASPADACRQLVVFGGTRKERANLGWWQPVNLPQLERTCSCLAAPGLFITSPPPNLLSSLHRPSLHANINSPSSAQFRSLLPER